MDLIVLPETAINFNFDELNQNNNRKNLGIDQIKNIIIGAVRTKKNGNDINIFNSMYLIKKKDKKVLYHDKLKLVPFGEFIPLRRFIKINKLSSGQLDFKKGIEPKFFKLSPKINILPLICYEVIFPELTSVLENNYNLIVNITNDAWYKNSSGFFSF